MEKIHFDAQRVILFLLLFGLLASSVLAYADAVPVVVGQERLSGAKAASQRLYDLDSKMQKNYTATQRLVGESLSPVIIALFNGEGGKYILRRNGNTEAVEPVPETYQQIKSVSHTLVGLFEIVAPYFKASGIDNWRPKLQEYSTMLKNALATLDQVGLPENAEKNCRTILQGGVRFADKALMSGSFSADEYSSYAKSVWPAVQQNIELAAKLQVDHFEEVLTEWKTEMGNEEWSRMYAIVGTAWAMRRENVHFQILAQMMGRDAINDRLIIAESIADPTEHDLIMLLGRIVNDRDLAVHVFGGKLEYRMDVELMGEAVHDETIRKMSPHHPAVPKDWMPYKEHKMPNEQ